MTAWLAMPLEGRLLVVGLASLLVAPAINWAIYSLAYNRRRISPWSEPDPAVGARRWSDRIPIVGWWGLRRESARHGRYFWVRPMLIEIAFPLAACGLYYYETVAGGLLMPILRQMVQVPPYDAWMQYLFLCHWLLLALMVVATFIDFDEQTVPDWITVPGTLTALVLASISRSAFMPVVHLDMGTGMGALVPVLMNEPRTWNPMWSGTRGLAVGWLLFSLWCLALTNRRVILRHGLGKAAGYFVAGFVRHTLWRVLLPIWGLGLVGIWIGYQWGDWESLLSALVGMAVGGGAVWAVRLVAGAAMGQEAMGFGDVTLMGMIGAFVGWQAALIAFPLAPMTAVLIVLVQFALTRNRAVPFGPYLCAGTLVTILGWDWVWNDYGDPAFHLGPVLPVLLVVLLFLMGAMLGIWRWIKERWILGDE